ncbi:HAD-like domain-containing protein [Aspergillus venezuelensis]
MSNVQDLPIGGRRFAPLNPSRSNESNSNAPQLKGIVFDVDGTLCLPQNYMFGEMREALGISKQVDILHHIRNLPTEDEKLEASNKIKAIEREAMKTQEPQPGLVELMEYLRDKDIKRALCTRNFEMPVTTLLQNHLPEHIFMPIITRETPGLLPKPDPAGILHIAKEWGLENRGEGLIMVGDSIDDMSAGHAAGAATVLLLNDHNGHLKEHMHTDLVIEKLHELIDILESGFVGTKTRVELPSVARRK